MYEPTQLSHIGNGYYLSAGGGVGELFGGHELIFEPVVGFTKSNGFSSNRLHFL